MICMYACMYMIYMCMYMCVYDINVCICVYAYDVYVCICMMYMCMYMCIDDVYVCICVYVYMSIQIQFTNHYTKKSCHSFEEKIYFYNRLFENGKKMEKLSKRKLSFIRVLDPKHVFRKI